MNDVETFKVEGLTVRIVYDEDPSNPRTDQDEAGKIITWHRKGNFGDDHKYQDPESLMLAIIDDDKFETRLEAWYERESQKIYDRHRYASDEYLRLHRDLEQEKRTRLMKRAERVAVILPVYLMDHGGYALSTGPFHCPWDSGQIGYTFMTYEKIKEEYSVKRVSRRAREKATQLLKLELETYDDFINGRVYGYIVEDESGNELDSCWGFYGLDYCHMESEAAAKCEAKRLTDEESAAASIGPCAQETAP